MQRSYLLKIVLHQIDNKFLTPDIEFDIHSYGQEITQQHQLQTLKISYSPVTGTFHIMHFHLLQISKNKEK